MCVIIVKSKNQGLPEKSSLKNCFNRNPDGAGFMYTDNNGKVVIDKGYMTFDKFYKRFEKLCEKYNDFEGKNLVMHMRISTAGGVKPQNTHPFPLTNKFYDMKKTYSKCNVGIVHNGIISATNPSKEQQDKGINDTMLFIKSYVYPIYKNWNKCFESEEFLAGIRIITNSKFAILDKNDNLHIVGNFTQFDGNYYSNDSYIGVQSYNKYFNNFVSNKYLDKYYDDYYDGYYDGYYDNYYTEEYYDSKKDNAEELEDEIKILEDTDYISVDGKHNKYVQVKELRTEEDSMFLYDEGSGILEEISPDGEETYNYYYDCEMIKKSQIEKIK